MKSEICPQCHLPWQVHPIDESGERTCSEFQVHTKIKVTP